LNAASLVQLAAARGIDLAHVAGVSSNLDGAARKRARTDVERELGIPDVRETVKGRETRGHRPPAWGVAELGQAAQGLGVIPWTAALYSFAGSQDGYWILWSALSSEANRIARREAWTAQVMSEDGHHRFYRENLSALVLDEDRSKHLFAAAPGLYAAYMHVAPATWDRHLAGPFSSLKSRYEGWLAVARSVIGKWVRNED
jgi:hypothetical protein